MAHTRNRRPNTFAILLWAVALALLVAGAIVRQIGIGNYAATYANSADITDELTYYTQIIGAQYTADLGNSLLAVGALSIVIALAFQALSAVIGRRFAVLAVDRTQVGDEGEGEVELGTDEGENPAGEDVAVAASGSGTATGSGTTGAEATVEHEVVVVESLVEAEVVPGAEPQAEDAPEPEQESEPEQEAAIVEAEAAPLSEPEPQLETEDPAAESASLPSSVETEEDVALVDVDGSADSEAAPSGTAGTKTTDAGTVDTAIDREQPSKVAVL
ncbi:MAG: hypothetical protein ACTJGR_07315 [Pauljensenia sp.]